MCLTETYRRVQVGKNLFDMFHIRNGLRQGDSLSPLLFNFVLEYAIRMVKVNQDGLKHTSLWFMPTMLIYVLGGSVHTIKKNTEAVLVGSKEIG